MDSGAPWIPPVAFAVAAAGGVALAVAWAWLRPASVVRHAGLVLVVTLLATVAAGALLVRPDPPGFRLAIDPSPEPLLPAGDPARPRYREAVRDFGEDEVYVVAMETDDVFTTGALRRLERLSREIARLEGVRSVRSLVDVTSFRWVPEPGWIEVRPLVEEVPTAPAELRALRERVLSDPLHPGTVVSADGAVAALDVRFRDLDDAALIASGLDRRIGEILEAESAPGVRFHVAGRPHVKSRVYETMVRDLRLLIPLALAAMAAVLALATGSWRGVAVPLGSVAVAVAWTFAGLVVLDRPLTILTTLLGPNLIVVGSVYGVHVLARHREDAAREVDPRRSARRCLEHVRLPVTVSGITTAIGYGALALTDVPAVREYGLFSALGVGFVTALSLTAVPAALARLPAPRALGGARRRPRVTERLEGWIERGLGVLGRVSTTRSRSVLAAGGILALAAGLLAPRMVIDTDYLSFFDAASPVRRDFEAVNRLLSGAVPLYVVLDGGAPGAFREPEALRGLERLHARVATIPGVSHARSLPDLLRVLNRVLAEDDPAAERIPDTRPGVAELIQLVPKGELARLTTIDQARANLVVRTGEVGSAAIRRLAASLREAAREAGLDPGIDVHVTGKAILLARSADAIAAGQVRSVGLAAATIFVLLAFLLRSPRLGAVAMVPNVLPVLLFFGLLGAGAAPLSLPTSLIASVALGIAIDDTVHYLVRYRRERMAGREPAEAAVVASHRVGQPIVVSTAMLILGFLVVAGSGFATLREFGALSAVTMALCLVTDLVFLPALLVRTRS